MATFSSSPSSLQDLKLAIEELESVVVKATKHISDARHYIDHLDELNQDVRSAFKELEINIHKMDSMLQGAAIAPSANDAQAVQQLLDFVTDKKRHQKFLMHEFRLANEQYLQKKKRLYAEHRKKLLEIAAPEDAASLDRSASLHQRQRRAATHDAENGRFQEQQQKSIQQSLERTRGMLAQNLERTANTMIALRQHSDLLNKAVEVQQDYSSDLSKTKSLLYRLKLTERLHQYLTLASFVFFCCVVFWIFESRLGLLRLAIRSVWFIISFLLFGWAQTNPQQSPETGTVV